MRLLKVRQLRNIHADLLRADPQRDTVTRVAARHGIWDFSQFTRSYKALFGESPSRTLRTPPSERRPLSTLGWLQYALRAFGDQVRPTSALSTVVDACDTSTGIANNADPDEYFYRIG
jgi:AraC-like DNA-binding protein